MTDKLLMNLNELNAKDIGIVMLIQNLEYNSQNIVTPTEKYLRTSINTTKRTKIKLI